MKLKKTLESVTENGLLKITIEITTVDCLTRSEAVSAMEDAIDGIIHNVADTRYFSNKVYKIKVK